ncbi:hypothetical protein [Streptomyces sp. NPDC089795]|uniref:hypothetical protein n=1 Tax=Streptomyces sp. NPDC089795 TaxID=3155297 RepID=UPI0034212DB0
MQRTLHTAHTRPGPAHTGAQAAVELLPRQRHTTLIRLTGEFDMDSVHILREALGAVPATTAIMDLTGVDFADAALLHALLDAPQNLVLAGPLPQHLQRLLDATGTTQLFTTAPVRP